MWQIIDLLSVNNISMYFNYVMVCKNSVKGIKHLYNTILQHVSTLFMEFAMFAVECALEISLCVLLTSVFNPLWHILNVKMVGQDKLGQAV